MLNNHQDRFARAALTLGLELIKDTSPVIMDSITLLSSAYRNIPYTATNGYSQKLDLFLPKNASVKPVPCIIFIHGGGWEVHKRASFEAPARYMASRGYATVNIDYRMLDQVTPMECVYDAKAAVRWVRANARKYNIDTAKVGACGASAGAQLTAVLATTGNDPTLQGDGGHLKFSDRIQVAVGFATPTLTGRQTWPRGNAVILPEWFDKISPYKHVTEDDAPMLFIHGAVDNVVAVDEVLDMHKRYLLNKTLSRLEIKAGQGHVLDLDRSMMESACCFFDTVFNQKLN